jgi:hypothetical protein
MVRKDLYYENFSRFMLHSRNDCCNKNQEIYSYSKWVFDRKTINDVSLKVLKITLKTQKCPVNGNKPVLINRLQTLYSQTKSAIIIQRIFRGFLVRESERLRGPAAKDMTICTNDTEFETMTPLVDVPTECFFSYRDERGFVYGFNLVSLIKMFATNDGKLINPYNREKVPSQVMDSLFSVYSKSKIIYDSPHI